MSPADSLVFDAFGRDLREGDAIVSPRNAPVFRVLKIVPVFDPAAPPGTIQFHTICMQTYTLRAGQRLGDVYRVGQMGEPAIGPMPLKLQGIEEIDRPDEEAATASGPRLVES